MDNNISSLANARITWVKFTRANVQYGVIIFTSELDDGTGAMFY